MRLHLLVALRHLGACLNRRSDGSVMPMFGLALVPVFGLVGAAVDYSRANNIRTGMQKALDSGLLAGARDGTFNWSNVALDIFNANLPARGGSVGAPVFTKNADGSYSGRVTGAVTTEFLRIMGVPSIPLGAQAAAVAPGPPGQYCVLALNRNAQPALQLTGNSAIDIKAPNCVLQVNSNSTGAVTLNGNTSITSAENCFVGTATKVGNASISPAPDAACKPVNDPFANYAKPTVGPCDYTNYSASGQNTITLQPGVYCGGMKFTGQVKVTFAPGLYIIKDGVLDAQGGSSFIGNGVTFFLTGLGASVQLAGQANWHLVASNSAPFAGFVFFLDPSGPSGLAASSSKLAGTAEMYFEGVIYFPQQNVTLTGGSQTSTPSPYTGYIVDTLDINGNGTLVINNDLTKTSVKIPSGLQLTLNGKPRLVQ